MAGPGIFMGGSCDPCCDGECFSNNSLLSSDYTENADWQCLVKTTTDVSSKEDIKTEHLDADGNVVNISNSYGEFVDQDPLVEETIDKVQRAGHFFYKTTTITVLNPETVENTDGTSTRTTKTVTTVTETAEVRRLSALVNVSSLWTPEAEDVYGGKILHNLRWHWKSTAVIDDKEEGSRWNPRRGRVFSMSSHEASSDGPQYRYPRDWPLELDRHPVDSSEFDSEMSSRLSAVPYNDRYEETYSFALHIGCSPDICDGKIKDWTWNPASRDYQDTHSPDIEFTGGTGRGACGRSKHTFSDAVFGFYPTDGFGSGYTAGDVLEYVFPYSDFGVQGESKTVTVHDVMEPVHSGKIVLMWGPVSNDISQSSGDMDDYYGIEVDDLYVEATPSLAYLKRLYHEFKQPYSVLYPDMASISKTWDRTERNTWVSKFTVDPSELHFCLSQVGLFKGIYREGESVRVQLVSGEDVAFDRTWSYEEEDSTVYYKAYTGQDGFDNSIMTDYQHRIREADWWFSDHVPSAHYNTSPSKGFGESNIPDPWEYAAANDQHPDDQFHGLTYSGKYFRMFSDGTGGEVTHADGLTPDDLPAFSRPGRGWFPTELTSTLPTGLPNHVYPRKLFSTSDFPLYFTNRAAGLEVNAGTNVHDGFLTPYQKLVRDSGDAIGYISTEGLFSYENPCPLHPTKITGSGYTIKITIESDRVIPYLAVYVNTVLDARETNGCDPQNACDYTPTKSIVRWGDCEILGSSGPIESQCSVGGFITNGCSTYFFPETGTSMWRHWTRDSITTNDIDSSLTTSQIFTNYIVPQSTPTQGSLTVEENVAYKYGDMQPLYVWNSNFHSGSPPTDPHNCYHTRHDDFVLDGYALGNMYSVFSQGCPNNEVTERSYYRQDAPEVRETDFMFTYASFNSETSFDPYHSSREHEFLAPLKFGFPSLQVTIGEAYQESFTLPTSEFSSGHVTKDNHEKWEAVSNLGHLYRDGYLQNDRHLVRYFSIGDNIKKPYDGVPFSGYIYKFPDGDLAFLEGSYLERGFTQDILFEIPEGSYRNPSEPVASGYTDEAIIFSTGILEIFSSLSYQESKEVLEQLTKLKDLGKNIGSTLVMALSESDLSVLESICSQAHGWIQPDIEYRFKKYEIEIERDEQGAITVTSEEFTWCKVTSSGFSEEQISDSDALEHLIIKDEFSSVSLRGDIEYFGIEGKYEEYAGHENSRYCSGGELVAGEFFFPDKKFFECNEYSYYPSPETQTMVESFDTYCNYGSGERCVYEDLLGTSPYRGEGFDIYSTFDIITDEMASQVSEYRDTQGTFLVNQFQLSHRNDARFPDYLGPWSNSINVILGFDGFKPSRTPEGSIGWDYIAERIDLPPPVDWPSVYTEAISSSRMFNSFDRSDYYIYRFNTYNECGETEYPAYRWNDSEPTHSVISGMATEYEITSLDMIIPDCEGSGTVNLGTSSAITSASWWTPVPMSLDSSVRYLSGRVTTTNHRLQFHKTNMLDVPIFHQKTVKRSDLAVSGYSITANKDTCIRVVIKDSDYSVPSWHDFSHEYDPNGPYSGTNHFVSFKVGYTFAATSIKYHQASYDHIESSLLDYIRETPDEHGNRTSRPIATPSTRKFVFKEAEFGPLEFYVVGDSGEDIITNYNSPSGLASLRGNPAGIDNEAKNGECYPPFFFNCYATGLTNSYRHSFPSKLEVGLTFPEDCVRGFSENLGGDEIIIPCLDTSEEEHATVSYTNFLPEECLLWKAIVR